MKILAMFIEGDYPVYWVKYKNGSFKITYGTYIKKYSKSEDIECCHDFGECIRHALECKGELN